MIYIYFGDLDHALKFIFLRKYINQSSRESLWKFTDFLPCGKSYFSKANLCSPNLDKGVPTQLGSSAVYPSFREESRCYALFLHLTELFAQDLRTRTIIVDFFNPEFCMKMAWIRYERKIKRGFRVCSRLKKNRSEIVAFYWLHLHYSKSSIEKYKSYFKSTIIVNLIEKSRWRENIWFKSSISCRSLI